MSYQVNDTLRNVYDEVENAIRITGGAAGGGSSDTKEATQLLVKAAVESIDGKVATVTAQNSQTLLLADLPILKNAGYAPGYDGTNVIGNSNFYSDPSGNLITRATCLTDEGTFRANFANSSISIPIGTMTFTNGSSDATGTFTDVTDIHMGDYVKLDADAENDWIQVSDVSGNSVVTLDGLYTGTGGTGAASRTLMKPTTANGGTVSVASGMLTLASGVTNNAIAKIKRFVDYSPLVSRGRMSISQRIANQTTVFGMEEDTAIPRWFARFTFDGAVNTVVKCETGRNPTGAPSASEIQLTTVTLPPLVTSALSNDYRIELLTEKVNFYINSILVAQHDKTIPSQHDDMTSVVYITNTAAVSNTNVLVDYVTGKNHNKIEIGVMSDTEQIVANQAPAQVYAYNQVGVININTDLLVIDCSQLRSLSIHCTSIGATGVVTGQWSNDPGFAAPITATLVTEAGVAGTTFNAAGLRTTPIRARYFRLRLTTATTAGTTTINVAGFQTDITAIVTTQPISGTITANIGTGSIAAGTNAIGDVGSQYRASATGASSFVAVMSTATPVATICKAGAGRLLGLILQNSSAAVRSVKFWNTAQGSVTLGTTAAIFEIDIPAGGFLNFKLEGGIGFATAITYAVTGAKGLTDNTGSLGVNDVTGILAFA